MILIRCDRCKKEHENATFYCVPTTGHIGIKLPKGWEYFEGQNGLQYDMQRNKHICPACAEEYHYGFLRTQPANTENVQ